MDKLEIEKKISQVLHEEFEVAQEALTKDSDIKEDMSLDSLDAVDLLVILEEEMEIEVDPKQFMECKTLGDIHEVVFKLVELKRA